MIHSDRRGLALTALLAVLLSGCTMTAPTPPGPVVLSDLAGTSWDFAPIGEKTMDPTSGEERSCRLEGQITLRSDGYFDYRARCVGDLDYRSYTGDEHTDVWSLNDGVLQLSFTNGFNVCDYDYNGGSFLGTCSNAKGETFGRILTPAN